MAKKKLDIVQEEEIKENISVEPLEEIMSSRYATYAKYVIQDRAIPDIRDGLKPVQRRIVYSMFENGDTFNKPTVKCARIVGDVMGKYHPHGDSSIYEALVRMSQDWKTRYPLIEFQGNNGSIDGDGPAAHRYTEARLSELSNELVKNIDKDSVLMQPNYDDKQLEPTVMPSRFPNLLVNGTEGIAIALATEIPTHNLGEVIDAIIYRIGHKNVTSLDLMNFVHGPDFPLGGIIYKSQGLEDIYTTGKGRIEIAGKSEIVEKKDINQIIITEIPYKVVKRTLVYEIDLIRASKAINGIIEVRDESDWQGIKIAVDLKKEAKADLVLKYLMNKTSLKTSYTANMVAIDGGKPKTITLLDYVDSYIAHQIDVITKESTYDLSKAKSRLEIVDGLIIASLNINEVIDIIRKSNDKTDAKANLMDKYNLSKDQVEAIVMMPLYKLSHTDELVLKNEKKELEKTIEYLNGILSDPNKLNRVLVKDLKTIKDKYGDERRTQIIEKEETKPLDKRDLIVAEDVMVAITKDGYIKRSSIKSYRGSGDDILPGIKEGDVLVGRAMASTKDYVLCFTNIGNYICLPVHIIQDNKWKDEGIHINNYITIASGEKIIKVMILNKMRNDLYLAFITKFGQIKRMALNEIDVSKKSRPTRCMKIMTNDALVGVELLTGNSDLLVITNNGNASLYNENDITIVGLKAGGVKSIMGLGKSYVAGITSFDESERGKVLLITDKGHKRVLDNNKVLRTNRLGKVTPIMPVFKSDNHKIVSVIKIDKNKDLIKLNLDYTNALPSEIIIDDFSLTDITKYAKKNMQTPAKSIIESAYNMDITVINKDIVSHPIVEKIKSKPEQNLIDEIEVSEEKKDKEDKGYEQVSIFDDLD